MLHPAPELDLPPDAVTQTFAILAKRGSGKTYTASVLAEELLKAGLHVVIADPVGVWWGLRASADGTGPGLPIALLGGNHGDVPLVVTAGELIADLVVDERLPAVLDLSLFRKGERTRFMTDFCERLYHRNRNPLHFILDEADEFAPQRPLPGQQRLLGAVDDLVRRGRARGLGVTLVTQRTAVLNKDVLTQTEVLVALRTIAPQDRDAIDAWVKVHGTTEQRTALMDSLPSLPIGRAWFWSPGWLDVFQQVQVRKRETFDSSATPKVGEAMRAPQQLAPVDIERLQERMAALVEQVEESDPQILRRRIAELEQRLKAGTAAPKVERVVERVEIPVLRDDQVEQLQVTVSTLAGVGSQLVQIAHDLSAALARVAVPTAQPVAAPQLAASNGQHAQLQPQVSYKPAQPPVQGQKPSQLVEEATKRIEGISRPQQRILDTLAALEALGLASIDKRSLAVLSGQSPKSSGYGNNLGTLRARSLIEYPAGGTAALTASGRAAARPGPQIHTLDDLHAAWFAWLPRPQVRILQALIAHYPEPMERAALAKAAEQSPTSSGYGNNLGAMRSLGLIAYPTGGLVAAMPLLFPDLST